MTLFHQWNARHQDRKNGPPQQTQGERDARTKPIGRPAPWNLKKRITERKRSQDPAHSFGGELKFFLEVFPCDGNIEAAEGCNQHDRCNDGDDAPLNVRALLGSQISSLANMFRFILA
jgi:hypothetical protein